MQSLRRQLRRGNAVLTLNSVTNRVEEVHRRGTSKEKWRLAQLDRLTETEDTYIEAVTFPLLAKDIAKGKTHKKGTFKTNY